MSATIVPESKFTQILKATTFVQPNEPRNELNAATEVVHVKQPVVAAAGASSSKCQRAMMKHSTKGMD